MMAHLTVDKVKPSSTKSRSKGYAATQYEDQNDEASVEFNEDEEIVSTQPQAAKQNHTKGGVYVWKLVRRMMTMRL